VLLAGFLLCGAASASDWPTFRKDAQRSGVTAEQLALPLAPAWTHTPAHPPSPAWPAAADVNRAVDHALQPSITFDRAFHVVADADTVYFGSSTDDSVYALNASTGEMRWRFVTEGPVRLAPVLDHGKVYAGSDDGNVYCLDARSGTLLWRYRAGEDKRLPGNGRMISLWPVRGGLVVDAGKVYFTAGIFPDRGVYLCALDAATGDKRYSKELEFSSQGTMVAATNRLFIATGRTSYRACEKDTGKPLTEFGASDPWKKNLIGGSFALAADDMLATGPSEGGQFHWFRFTDRTALTQDVAASMLVKDAVVYALSKGQLKAFARADYLAAPTPAKQVAPPAPSKAAAPPAPRPPPPPQWAVPAKNARTMIMARQTIITGGQNEIATFDAQDGRSLWTGTVDGVVEGLACSNGRLFASLDNGTIVCLQQAAASAAGPHPPAVKPADSYPPNALLAQAAEEAIKAASTTQGYCLVLQSETGQLAYEIAKRSKFHVICREEDTAKVEASRAALIKAGLYGTRVVVHQGQSRDLPYPRCFANLIVCEGALTHGASLPPADDVLRALRPCGGVVDIAVQPGSKASRRLSGWGGELPNWTVKEGALTRGTATRGRLPGSGEWSHFYADPGNTACSGDELRAGKMDLQWFGRPDPAEMIDRHKKGPAPLFVNGRLFVPGYNYVAAVDAYNGCVLWERRIQDSARIAAFKDSSSIAANSDRLFVASGGACLVLDAKTGNTERQVPVPGAGADQAWGYLAVVDGAIVGSTAKAGGSLRAMGKLEGDIVWKNNQPVVCSTSVFAVDAVAGQAKWTYAARTGMIVNPTIVVGNGQVFFVESGNAKTLESKDGRITLADLVGQGARLVAVELASGRVAWSQNIDISTLQHVIYMSYANGTLLISGSKHVTVDPSENRGRPKPEQLKRVRYDLFAYDAAKGAQRWKATAAPNYDEILDSKHGEQVQHPAIVGDIVYGPAFAVQLSTGKAHDGWKWRKSAKCATLSTSRYCAFSRYSDAKLPHIFDLKSGKGTPLSIATRPGCWINTLPAGGMILIPEASAGCTCPYPFQTSLAFMPAE
jgi:outer membrane protein assembly factor BamB